MPLFGLSLTDIDEMKAKRNINGLVKALSYKKDTGVQCAAANALGQIGDLSTINQLLGALKDPSPVVRCSVVDALGLLHDKKAVWGLIGEFEDSEIEVRRKVISALVNIGGRDGVQGLLVGLGNEVQEIRTLTVDALLKVGGYYGMTGLMVAVGQKDMTVQLRAISNFERMGGTQAENGLRAAQKNKTFDPRIQLELEKALSRMHEANAINPSANIFEEPDINEILNEALARLKEHKSAGNLESELPPKKGDVIGQRYEVRKELGHGGFGIVYLATTKTGEVCALKTFKDEYLTDMQAREMFQKEAKVWIQLGSHPYLVRAYLVEQVSGRLYIAMEYIAPNEAGLNSLEGHLKLQSPGIAQSLKWAIQFCYGMEYAYAKGVRCHRDIKPANIMISKDKAVKITDFGLASILNLAGSGSNTNVNVNREQIKCAGTPTHMPPEQFTSFETCDQRSDIYSFGIVLYQMATDGNLPFFASSPAELYLLHSKAKVPKLNSPLFPVIQHCLEKKPEDRYQSFEKLRRDLEQLMEHLTGEVWKPPELNEFRADEWDNKGVSLFALGNFDEAIKCHDEALQINQLKTSAWVNKGNCLRALNRIEEAVKCYEKALLLDPLESIAWNNKANILNCLTRYEEAISCLDKALDIDPQLADAWNNKGVSLSALHRFDEAIKCHDKAIEIDPKNLTAWNRKGLILINLGRYDDAISCLEKALEINPQSTDAWNNKGIGLFASGHFDEAISCYDKALEIQPKDALAWSNKANCFISLGRYIEAIKCCNEALDIDSKHYAALFLKAFAADKLGWKRDAMMYYQKCVEVAPAYDVKTTMMARLRLGELIRER